MSELEKLAKNSLAKLRILPRKKWGQNFMIHEEMLAFIADSLPIQEGEKVLEIGPGLGFLTKKLLERGANLFAIEKDPLFVDYLQGAYKDRTFKVAQGDILDFDISKALNPGESVQVVGNIPYNITSPILEWLIVHRRFIKKALITMQYEVAERLTARPGSKIWGCLSIFAQLHSRVSLLKKIGSGYFYPEPKVDSAVVQLDFSEASVFAPHDEALLSKIVRRSFQKRRKTLLNSLIDKENPIYSKKNLSRVLEELEIDSQRRPETLSIDEWIAVAIAISC